MTYTPITSNGKFGRFFVAFLAAAMILAPGLAPSAHADIDETSLNDIFDGRGRPIEDILIGVNSAPIAEVEGQEADTGGWETTNPDEGMADSNPNAPERREFWDRLQEKAFDQICKNIKLQTKVGADISEIADIKFRPSRRLYRYPTGKFALVDGGEITLGVGKSFEVLDLAEDFHLGIGVHANLRGETSVIRPLESKSSCKEIAKLLKLWTFKTALPMTAKRISEMAEGELWKLPLSLNVGVSAGISGDLTKDFPISVSLGSSQEDRVSVSLYRVAPDVLRFRLRLDRAEIRDKSGRVVYNLPTVDLAIPGEGVILGFLTSQAERLIGRELDRYITASLELANHRREGRQFVLEFLLDPNDKEQMKQLVEVLKGDLSALRMLMKMVRKIDKILNGDEDAQKELERIAREHALKLGSKETFAGVDLYKRENDRFRLLFPFLVEYQSGNGRSEDHMVLLDKNGAEYDIYQGSKGSESGWWEVPFVGQLVKHNEQQSVRTFTHKDKNGAQTAPVALYSLQEGFLRSNESSVRRMAERANDIIKYAGARGQGINKDTALPLDALFPEEAAQKEADGGSEDDDDRSSSKTYKRGLMVFSLALSMKAVDDILYAPAEEVMKAYLNTLSGEKREMLSAVLNEGSVRPGGKLEYNAGKIAGKFSRHHGPRSGADNDRFQATREIRALADRATEIVQDLIKARRAGTPQRQADAFRKVMAGSGKSGLGYEDIMKVLIQLADAKDITAEFTLNVDKKIKGEKNTDSRYVLNKGGGDAELVGGMSRTAARFAEPTRLND